MKKENTMITDWLDEHGDPEIEKKIIVKMKNNTAMSWLLDQYLKKDGLSKSDFIKAFEMEEQQITKAFYDGYYQEELKDYKSYYTETFKPGQDERFK